MFHDFNFARIRKNIGVICCQGRTSRLDNTPEDFMEYSFYRLGSPSQYRSKHVDSMLLLNYRDSKIRQKDYRQGVNTK